MSKNPPGARRVVPRSRGALSGIALMVLGAWGALIPFIGPYFNFSFTPDDAWHWTAARGWLEVLPGAAAFVAGFLLLVSKSRTMTLVAAWLGIVAGAWFVVGRDLQTVWHIGSPGSPAGFSDGLRVLEVLALFTLLGVVIVYLAATAFGRLSVVSLRDAHAAERREAAAAAETERERQIAAARERDEAAAREQEAAGREREAAAAAAAHESKATDRDDNLDRGQDGPHVDDLENADNADSADSADSQKVESHQVAGPVGSTAAAGDGTQHDNQDRTGERSTNVAHSVTQDGSGQQAYAQQPQQGYAQPQNYTPPNYAPPNSDPQNETQNETQTQTQHEGLGRRLFHRR